MSPSLPQLVMRRPHLRRLPQAAIAPGYQVRDFRNGDETSWNQVLAAAFERDLSEFDFDRMMRRDPAFLPQRVQVVVTSDEVVVATASSWVTERAGVDHSVLHWVGTHPEHVGLRLGYEVSLAALQQAQSERRAAVWLLTDDHRVAAIKTYLRLGFVPVLTDESHAARWREALDSIDANSPHLALLDGPLESY